MPYPKHFVGQALWLYHRLNLSHRDIEDLLPQRGISVSRETMPETIHVTDHYVNNRSEQSHEATGVRERGMRGAASRRFKPVVQAQRFVTAHAAGQNLFNLGRHLVRAEHYRNLRISAFGEWSRAVA